MTTISPLHADATALRTAAQELLNACVEDMGYGDETGDYPDRDDEPVGASAKGPCAVQFGHMRRLRDALARPAPDATPAGADVEALRALSDAAGVTFDSSLQIEQIPQYGGPGALMGWHFSNPTEGRKQLSALIKLALYVRTHVLTTPPASAADGEGLRDAALAVAIEDLKGTAAKVRAGASGDKVAAWIEMSVRDLETTPPPAVPATRVGGLDREAVAKIVEHAMCSQLSEATHVYFTGCSGRDLNEAVDAILALALAHQTSAPAGDAVEALRRTAEGYSQRVCEWDDRTSPEDYPHHLLITARELEDLLIEFAGEPAALAAIAQGPGAGPADWQRMREACARHLEATAESMMSGARGGLGEMFGEQSASDLRQQARAIRELPLPATPATAASEGDGV